MSRGMGVRRMRFGYRAQYVVCYVVCTVGLKSLWLQINKNQLIIIIVHWNDGGNYTYPDQSEEMNRQVEGIMSGHAP